MAVTLMSARICCSRLVVVACFTHTYPKWTMGGYYSNLFFFFSEVSEPPQTQAFEAGNNFDLAIRSSCPACSGSTGCTISFSLCHFLSSVDSQDKSGVPYCWCLIKRFWVLDPWFQVKSKFVTRPSNSGRISQEERRNAQTQIGQNWESYY